MNEKSILLAYASRFGSTQEAAETIASTLNKAWLGVNLRSIESNAADRKRLATTSK